MVVIHTFTHTEIHAGQNLNLTTIQQTVTDFIRRSHVNTIQQVTVKQLLNTFHGFNYEHKLPQNYLIFFSSRHNT